MAKTNASLERLGLKEEDAARLLSGSQGLQRGKPVERCLAPPAAQSRGLVVHALHRRFRADVVLGPHLPPALPLGPQPAGATAGPGLRLGGLRLPCRTCPKARRSPTSTSRTSTGPGLGAFLEPIRLWCACASRSLGAGKPGTGWAPTNWAATSCRASCGAVEPRSSWPGGRAVLAPDRSGLRVLLGPHGRQGRQPDDAHRRHPLLDPLHLRGDLFDHPDR